MAKKGKIHFNSDGAWTYCVGKDFVVIWGPTKKYIVHCHTIKGISHEAFWDRKDHGSQDGMITPSEISDYIRKNLIKV